VTRAVQNTTVGLAGIIIIIIIELPQIDRR